MQTDCILNPHPQDDDILSPIADWLTVYLHDINQFPLLSHQEQSALFKEFHAGNLEARTQLINCNLRLAYSIAKKYRPFFITFEFQDMIQEANIGLATAVEKYDYTLGYTFSTYASWWISQAIQRAFPRHNSGLHISHHQYMDSSRIKKVISELSIKNQRVPTDEEIAEALGFSVTRVQRSRKFPYTISIHCELSVDDESDVTLLDILPDEKATELVDAVIISNDDTPNFVNQKLENSIILKRERDIIKMHFGIEQDHPMTFEEIAREFKVSRQKIYDIFDRGMRKLRLICSTEEIPRELFT